MMCSVDPVSNNQLPDLQNRFTSTQLDEFLSFLQSMGNENRPVYSTSGSGGSDEPPNRKDSDDKDEKKRKRKISNRESAKRSRWRKKRHLEELNAKASQLRAENREHKNRLGLLLHQLHTVRAQNNRLRFESIRLLQRHSDLNRVLQARHLI